MNRTQVGIVIVVAWVTIGLVVGLLMGRRGHHALASMALGVVLGPLMIPLARNSTRDEARSRPHELIPGVAGAGTVDVLVGIDGSPASEAALHAVAGLLGSRIGRLTLVCVVDYDSVGSTPPWDEEVRATEVLERLRSSVQDLTPGTAVLPGQPAAALMKEAVEGGYELLVIGKRGHGAAKALMGSTASRLAHGANVPILIV